MTGPSADQRVECAADRTVRSAVLGVGVAALRAGIVLAVLDAATDLLFVIGGGRGTVEAVAEGLLLMTLAVAALVRVDYAAAILTRPGRVTILAGLFAAVGAIDLGLQNHYGEVALAIMFIAALVSSWRWVTLSLAVSVFGYLGDLAANGRSLDWMLIAAGDSGVKIVELVLNAVAGMVMVVLLRRFMGHVSVSLRDARTSRLAITPALACAVAAGSAGQLPRADPLALIEALTPAERNVLALLVDGRAPKQAARDLCVAISTIRSHIASAKRKTGARTLEQLVALFAEADVAT